MRVKYLQAHYFEFPSTGKLVELLSQQNDRVLQSLAAFIFHGMKLRNEIIDFNIKYLNLCINRNVNLKLLLYDWPIRHWSKE